MLGWESHPLGHPCYGTVSINRNEDGTLAGVHGRGMDKATKQMLDLPPIPLEARKLADAEVEVIVRVKVEVEKLVQRHQDTSG